MLRLHTDTSLHRLHLYHAHVFLQDIRMIPQVRKHTDICDIQIISDLHKSEVYQVAKYYNVLPDIINRTPKGDVHDGKTDEEMIGTSYDMVELYTGYFLNKPRAFHNLTDSEKAKWKLACDAIEARRAMSYFKYDNGLSCYFIDVMERTVLDGWK